MRILYLTRSDSVHDQRFMQTLAESSHEAFVLRLFPGEFPTPPGVTALNWTGFEDGLQPWNLPVAQRALEKIVSEVEPDLIHAGPLPDLAFLAAKIEFKNLLAMSWGFDLMHDVHVSKLDEHRTRFALNNARALITDAYSSAEVAINLGFPAEKIVIFPWGVDLDHFSPQNAKTAGAQWREKMNWQEKHVLLCLRSWEPNYGVDVLLHAFTQAIRENPDLRLILLGDGSLHDQYMGILSSETLQDKIFIGGRVPNQDLITYFGAADVYITPSHIDGSSVSLMEALACGLPTIASDIPANLEWVQPGKNGWVFTDNDIEELKNTILNVSALSLDEIAQTARLIATEKADWHKNKQKLLALYQQLSTNQGS